MRILSLYLKDSKLDFLYMVSTNLRELVRKWQIKKEKVYGPKES